MKKLVIAIGIGLMSGSLWASCVGPFCWDDKGASIGGIVQDGNGDGSPNYTIAQINALVPSAKGQSVFCSDCKGGGAAGTICTSTATAAGGFDYVLTTGTICK